MTMTARPTIYDGIKFRSRLEARWAAYFDDWGWNWAYEPQAFTDPEWPHDEYLPDFRVLDHPEGPVCYWEIKPDCLDSWGRQIAEEKLSIILNYEPDATLVLAVGNPGEHREWSNTPRLWRLTYGAAERQGGA